MDNELVIKHHTFIHERVEAVLGVRNIPHIVRIGGYPAEYQDVIRYDVCIIFYAIPPWSIEVYMSKDGVEEVVHRESMAIELCKHRDTFSERILADRIMEIVHKQGLCDFCMQSGSNGSIIQSSLNGVKMFTIETLGKYIDIRGPYTTSQDPLRRILIGDKKETADEVCTALRMLHNFYFHRTPGCMSQFVKIYDIYDILEDMGATDLKIYLWNANISMSMKLYDAKVNVHGNDFVYFVEFIKSPREVHMNISTGKRNLMKTYINKLWKKFRKLVDTDWTGYANVRV